MNGCALIRVWVAANKSITTLEKCCHRERGDCLANALLGKGAEVYTLHPALLGYCSAPKWVDGDVNLPVCVCMNLPMCVCVCVNCT